MSLVYPVIHYLNDTLALEQASIASDAGAAGVFLISHHNNDERLWPLAQQVKSLYPQLKVGVNGLSTPLQEVAQKVSDYHLDMLWSDNCGITSKGVESKALALQLWHQTHPSVEVFASVAFKYQAAEPNPSLAALYAQGLGFIATTSGSATGSAPEVEKIKKMYEAVEDKLRRDFSAHCATLAIASGMTLENVEDFKPYLSHILVATGVSHNEHKLDYERLCVFIQRAK